MNTTTSALSVIDALLHSVWQEGGTDMLLTVGSVPLMRVDGSLRPIAGRAALTNSDTAALADSLLNAEQRAAFAHGSELDFSFDWAGNARIRGNAYRQRGAVALALRIIPRVIPSMSDLGLPPVVTEFVRRPHGLVLVTGPTGAGKSTTLASMIDLINTERACHILTIEDPIEYLHDHKRSAVSQREVGTDTESFPTALRAALREDPDVLLVGEMRDLESIRLALTTAETGHLVFATLHTNDSAQSLSRIVDVFPGAQQDQIRVQLAAALTGIVYQRLVPRIGGGMVAAYEVLVANTAVRNLVREGKTSQLRNALVTGQKDGMCTLEQSLSHLVRSGKIAFEEALAQSLYPKDLEGAAPSRLAGVGRRL